MFERLFFNDKRYDLAEVGRYKMNRRLKPGCRSRRRTTLTPADFLAIIHEMIAAVPGPQAELDDIDHFGNRRIRSVGELLANQFSVGLSRMARIIKERMNLADKEKPISPADLVNARTVSAVIQSLLRQLPAEPVHGPDQPAERADAQAAPERLWAPAACTATARASRSATSTTRTMAACARSRRRKVRTSV